SPTCSPSPYTALFRSAGAHPAGAVGRPRVVHRDRKRAEVSVAPGQGRDGDEARLCLPVVAVPAVGDEEERAVLLDRPAEGESEQIGRAHVRTPVTVAA